MPAVDRSVLRSLAPPGLTALVIASAVVATRVASGPAAAVVMTLLLAGALGLLAVLVLLPRPGVRRRVTGRDLAAEWARVEPEWSARPRNE